MESAEQAWTHSPALLKPGRELAAPSVKQASAAVGATCGRPPTTWRERKLAELRTPAVARKWRFRMNMPMDSFVSMFEKGVQ